MKLLLGLLLTATAVLGLEARWSWHRKGKQVDRSDVYSDPICLNGGTFIAIYDEQGYCSCARGFRGRKCEIDTSAKCFNGNGVHYRGTVSWSHSGHRCLRWDHSSRVLSEPWALSRGLGKHNYCRNPDQSDRPWCIVQRKSQIVREPCDIPKCEEEPMPKCGERPQKLYKIVGGKIATVESQPWIAAIFQQTRRYRGNFFLCGGTLIDPCWVLTAAHCFNDGKDTDVKLLSVTLGKNAINETDESREQTFEVDTLIIHEKYDNHHGNYDNDIALLKIKGSCAKTTRSVRTACLPPENRMLPPGVTCDVAGYGKESQSSFQNSQYLKETKVKLLSQSVCTDKDYYGNMVTKNMFCAGSPDWSTDSCKGDSGGPLVCEVGNRMFLFGIVSWGEGCSRAFRPGVYTRVTNYNSWINEKTGLSSVTSGSMYPQK